MYLAHSLYMACLWGCRLLCRNSRTPDSLTSYSPKKYLKLDVGWFHPCIKCGILTSNELSYMILIRRDYEQITVNCCRVCRNKLSNVMSRNDFLAVLVIKFIFDNLTFERIRTFSSFLTQCW